MIAITISIAINSGSDVDSNSDSFSKNGPRVSSGDNNYCRTIDDSTIGEGDDQPSPTYRDIDQCALCEGTFSNITFILINVRLGWPKIAIIARRHI